MKKQSSRKPRNKAKDTALAIALAGVPGLDAVIKKADEPKPMLSIQPSSILSNPMGYIDELTRCNPFWGGVATRVLCNTIGYNVVNTILWDYRKRNVAPAVTSTIDWYNDTMAEIEEKQQNVANLKEQGHTVLAFLDGKTMIGAYKYLFSLVNAIDADNTGTMERPEPAVLYDRMRQKDRDRSEVLAEYDTFQMERFKDSPNFEYIKARLERNKKANDTRAVRKAQDELDHIHAEIAAVKREVFDDGVWARIPLHMQFRIMKSVHNQINSAIAAEMEKPADERLHLEALNELAEIVLLELKAADHTVEVKTAFERGILKPETHALIGSENAKVVPQ